MNILIFAGGSGTRLWPISRKSTPKQILKLVGDKTLLENTYERCRSWVKQDRIFIATLNDYKNVIKKQLPEIPISKYSLEPVLRDRGPAIALAALIMHHDDPESTFMTMWSDHHIKEPRNYFKKLLQSAEKYLNNNPNKVLTIGVKPTHPHTGFGYIKKQSKIPNKLGLPLFKVNSFKEKPDLKTAEKFLKSGKYLWNSGYFIWKTKTLLDLYKKHLPEVYELLNKIEPYIGTKKQQWAINKFYPLMPKVEIENGIIEKIKNDITTIEAGFDWIDIGSWKEIKDVQSKQKENFSRGLHLGHETSNSLIYNFNPKQLVTTLHTKDLVIVVTPDAVLISDKDKSIELKEIIKKLKEDKTFKKYL